jgi:hypothetical protein
MRTDDRELREQILRLSVSEARMVEIRNSTLRYIHEEAKSQR